MWVGRWPPIISHPAGVLGHLFCSHAFPGCPSVLLLSMPGLAGSGENAENVCVPEAGVGLAILGAPAPDSGTARSRCGVSFCTG